MKFILFIIIMVLVVVGAFFYLNREPCEECGAAQAAYCEELLNEYRIDGELRIGYIDRIRMVMRGCL